MFYALVCVPTFGRNSRVSRVWILSGVISCKSSVSAGELLHAQHGPGRGGRRRERGRRERRKEEGEREGGREGGRAMEGNKVEGEEVKEERREEEKREECGLRNSCSC